MNFCRLALFAALLALSTHSTYAKTWMPDNGNGTFTNPLFYDEFSDPDMIRVGEDFYLVGTTMHAMPGIPVMHSFRRNHQKNCTNKSRC